MAPIPARGTVAVTGAAGYIGGWTAHALLERGYRVRACVRDPADDAKVGFLKAMPGYASGRLTLHGAKRHFLHRDIEQSDVIITTYALLLRDQLFLEREWHIAILDEAQAIKNSLSRTAKATRRLRAAHRVALTGTPVENRLAELWSIMDFLNPGMLGSSELFRTRYAIPVERHGASEPAARLRAITRPYILRRLKTDPAIIDDLPEKIEMKEYCQLTV